MVRLVEPIQLSNSSTHLNLFSSHVAKPRPSLPIWYLQTNFGGGETCGARLCAMQSMPLSY